MSRRRSRSGPRENWESTSSESDSTQAGSFHANHDWTDSDNNSDSDSHSLDNDYRGRGRNRDARRSRSPSRDRSSESRLDRYPSPSRERNQPPSPTTSELYYGRWISPSPRRSQHDDPETYSPPSRGRDDRLDHWTDPWDRYDRMIGRTGQWTFDNYNWERADVLRRRDSRNWADRWRAYDYGQPRDRGAYRDSPVEHVSSDADSGDSR